jgi:hypothetical protein
MRRDWEKKKLGRNTSDDRFQVSSRDIATSILMLNLKGRELNKKFDRMIYL